MFKKSSLPTPDIGDLTVSAAKCLHFLALHHGSQNGWNGKITSLSTYV